MGFRVRDDNDSCTWIPDQLRPDHESPVLAFGQRFYAVSGHLAQSQVGQHLSDPGVFDVSADLRADGQIGRVVKRLLYGQRRDEIRPVADISATLIEHRLGERPAVQEDLPPR